MEKYVNTTDGSDQRRCAAEMGGRWLRWLGHQRVKTPPHWNFAISEIRCRWEVGGSTQFFRSKYNEVRYFASIKQRCNFALFMLVSALMGLERMQAAYAHAIANEYRFYSYGDSSLLLP